MRKERDKDNDVTGSEERVGLEKRIETRQRGRGKNERRIKRRRKETKGGRVFFLFS